MNICVVNFERKGESCRFSVDGNRAQSVSRNTVSVSVTRICEKPMKDTESIPTSTIIGNEGNFHTHLPFLLYLNISTAITHFSLVNKWPILTIYSDFQYHYVFT